MGRGSKDLKVTRGQILKYLVFPAKDFEFYPVLNSV